MTSKLRDKIREVTQDTILQAAEEVFAEEGLTEAKMESIAGRAGVAVGTLYNHFKDREALFGALYRLKLERVLQGLDEVLTKESGKPFRHALTVFYETLLEHFFSQRNFLAILMQSEHKRGHHSPVSGPSEFMRELYMRAEKLVKQGVKEKALRAGPHAELLPGICISMLRSVLIRELLYQPSQTPAPERAAQLASLFLDGAKALP